MKTSLIDAAAIGPGILRRIFSTRVLRELSQTGSAPALESVVRMFHRRQQLDESITLADVYEVSYAECARSKRIEYVYKNALVEKQILGRHSLRTSSAMFEVAVGSSKLDALLLTKEASAYEIKTERDELGKLASQIADYRKAFAKVWVFSSERHLSSIERQLPAEVGISILGGRYRISVLREAVEFAGDLSSHSMLRLLQKRELLDLIGDHSGETPNTKVFSEALKIADRLSKVGLNQYVVRVLKKRALNNTALAEVLPRCLAATALALRLTPIQTERLVKILESPAIRIV